MRCPVSGRAGDSHPRHLRLIAALGALAAAPLSFADDDPAPYPTEDWPVSAPAEQGLDPERLDKLVELIREGEQFPDLDSLLVIRHGYLVCEEYFRGYDADELHMIQSVTKSFTSAAMGIAIEQGHIKGVDERIIDFFPDLEGIENVDDRKRAMTIEDLLTMRSGTDYHERGPDSPHFQLNALSEGWTEFVLSRPMVTEPGTHFQYDSGGVILMSALIKARTGEHADAFMKEHLLKPLGIEDYRWHRNDEGHPHTGGGLRMLPRDMAKLGLLYLHKGKWEDEQIVPATWVEASTKLQVEFPGRPGGMGAGYGYLWWIVRPAEDVDAFPHAYAACGWRGQYIFVVPEHDLVVVVTGHTSNNEDENRPIGFLFTHILPAIVK